MPFDNNLDCVKNGWILLNCVAYVVIRLMFNMGWNSLRFCYTALHFLKCNLSQPMLYSYNLGSFWIHSLDVWSFLLFLFWWTINTCYHRSIFCIKKIKNLLFCRRETCNVRSAWGAKFIYKLIIVYRWHVAGKTQFATIKSALTPLMRNENLVIP